MQHYNATLLSFVPLVGWYRYRNLFQFVPASPNNPRPPYDESGHYPLQLEVSYDPQVCPERTSIIWHRDVWEHDRYEFIRNKLSNKKIKPADGYYEGIQRNTKRDRLPAIIFEVSCLLTLFTNHRIFKYDREGKQCWFIPLTGSNPKAAENPTASVWGQIGYMTSNNGSIEEFSKPGCDHAKMVPMKEYYAQWRDPRCCGPEYHLDLPDILDQLLDAYLFLENSQKKAFYAACHLYNQALDIYNNAPSLSLIAAVSAIEALIKSEQLNDGEKVTKCKECGASPSVETCSCCGLPRHRVGSRFREFLTRYGSLELKKFSDNLYKFRSSIAHTGELLREDLFDHGFYVGVDEKDEQEMFRRNALEVVRRTMLNWLLEHLPMRSNLL